jgi:Spy/CpxP family protein refolding chaperone
MTQLTKNKIILYLATIFLVGGITGGVLGWTGARQRGMESPSPKKMCDHFRDRLSADLALTPAQLHQLDPLLEKRARGMEAVHTRTIQELEELIRASNEEIAVALGLTPEQRAKLEEMEARRQEFMRRRFKARSDGP